MFGSLFDDERPLGVMTDVHTVVSPRPPNRRLLCGLSGIENQGATCYLNSLLQTLLFTPEFREGLFGLSETELGCLDNRDKGGGKVRIIPLQLQRLFARLLLVDQQAASTTDLTDSFGWSNNEELQQHDVQELNRILFSAIDSSLVCTSGKDLITKLYHGSTISEIVCQTCGKISEKEEDFLDLNVIVANYNNLQDSLNATFLQQEVMKGKNQYRCSTCCNLVDAKKGSKIQCLPVILTFSLLRFSYDIAKCERYKETGKFLFPFEIDMAPYCNKEMKSGDSVYELFSLVIHSGCSYGGHYHAYIRDVDGLGKWFPPNIAESMRSMLYSSYLANTVLMAFLWPTSRIDGELMANGMPLLAIIWQLDGSCGSGKVNYTFSGPEAIDWYRSGIFFAGYRMWPRSDSLNGSANEYFLLDYFCWNVADHVGQQILP